MIFTIPENNFFYEIKNGNLYYKGKFIKYKSQLNRGNVSRESITPYASGVLVSYDERGLTTLTFWGNDGYELYSTRLATKFIDEGKVKFLPCVNGIFVEDYTLKTPSCAFHSYAGPSYFGESREDIQEQMRRDRKRGRSL